MWSGYLCTEESEREREDARAFYEGYATTGLDMSVVMCSVCQRDGVGSPCVVREILTSWRERVTHGEKRGRPARSSATDGE